MKLLKKAFAFTFIFMLSVSGLTGYQVNASEEPKHLDILFTHDLHSHLNSFQTIVDGTQQETGGFARLKTLINEHVSFLKADVFTLIEAPESISIIAFFKPS